ncbi:MAG: hypothetical protein HYX27_10320 [Acidobacteria bacterium]|nr:hypothetical protein [Acidobacteriota bacterium]
MRLKLKTVCKRSLDRVNLVAIVCHSRIFQNQSGQDLIEYTLMAATIAVAVGAIFPASVAPNISTIFSKISSSLGAANN